MGRIDEDVQAVGQWAFTKMPTFPAGITDAMIAALAKIDQSKLGHQHRIPYNQPNTAATTETRVLYRCYGATATVIELACGSIAIAVGAATVTFDLKKNGTTVLTGVLTLNSSNTARVAVLASLSGTVTLAAGDVLELVVTATASGGTLPTGIFAELTVKEDAQ